MSNKGIPLSRYLQRPKWERDASEADPLDGRGRKLVDDRTLDEIERGTLPDGLARALLDEMAIAWETGQRVRQPFENSNEESHTRAQVERKEWQAQAAELWAKPQHASKSKSDIARLIERESGGNWNTIRKHI